MGEMAYYRRLEFALAVQRADDRDASSLLAFKPWTRGLVRPAL